MHQVPELLVCENLVNTQQKTPHNKHPKHHSCLLIYVKEGLRSDKVLDLTSATPRTCAQTTELQQQQRCFERVSRFINLYTKPQPFTNPNQRAVD